MNICLIHQQQYWVYCPQCPARIAATTNTTNLDTRVDVVTDSDGLPTIKVNVVETKEQIEARVRDEDFEFYMRLLKANNGGGAMTAAMWLLFESDYYDRGFGRDTARWKHYLKRLEKKE